MKRNWLRLSQLQKEILKQIADEELKRITENFTDMLNWKGKVKVSDVYFVNIKRLHKRIPSPKMHLLGVHSSIGGDLEGVGGILFEHVDGKRLARNIIQNIIVQRKGKEESKSLREIEKDALMELANMLLGSYLNGFAEYLGFETVYHVPKLTQTVTENYVDDVTSESKGNFEYAIIFKNNFISRGEYKIDGNFSLLFEQKSVQKLIKKLEEMS